MIAILFRRSLAHGFLHERGDTRFFLCGQFFQRESHRPHAAVVEHGLVAEAERGVTRFELAGDKITVV